jgi:undecaprenyl-diphosphatase
MNIIHAIILGVVEGITEFLPISSTGHLIFVSKLLNIVQTDFVKTFEISIQLGAILAIIILYWKKIFLNRGIIKKVLVAFIPTGIIGFILYKIVKGYLLGNLWLVIGSLAVVGLILIIVELYLGRGRKFSARTNSLEKISYGQAVTIGVVQSLGMVPGVSRSGATIIGGLIMGIDRQTIVDFSFLLAIPTMLAATGYDLLKSYKLISSADFGILGVGFLVSFLVAIPAVIFLIKFVKKYNFIGFGIYRIVIAIIFMAILLR